MYIHIYIYICIYIYIYEAGPVPRPDRLWPGPTWNVTTEMSYSFPTHISHVIWPSSGKAISPARAGLEHMMNPEVLEHVFPPYPGIC